MKNPELAAASIENTVTGPIVAVRLDGVRFSKLTKSPVFVKPFDLGFAEAMRAAMMSLVSSDLGAPCVMAYTQSDEITVLLDFSRSSWLGGRATKITTTMASLTATAFTRDLIERDQCPEGAIMFDARLIDFGSDIEKALELLDWRLADAAINSTTSWARHVLGRKEIVGVSTRDMREKLREVGRAWEDNLSDDLRFGTYAVRQPRHVRLDGVGTVTRHHWVAVPVLGTDIASVVRNTFAEQEV